MTAAGRCACGAVRFSASLEKAEAGVCHCKICRCWCGGTPLATSHAEIKLLADKALCWWKSSEWCERGFCGECGSSLFWRNPQGIGPWGVSVGALEETAELGELKIARHIYADRKPAFYDFSDNAPRQTGPEWVAEILSGLAKQFGDDFLQDALKKSRAHHGNAFTDQVEKLIADSSAQ